MPTLLQDLRFGLRILLKKPSLTAAAVISLALGLGANSAIFSAVNAVLLRPLPYDEPQQLVWIWEENLTSNIQQEPASFPNFLDWKNQNGAFEDIAAFTNWLPALTDAGEPERIAGAVVSASFFSVLRVTPLLGRTFSPDDDQPGYNRVVILSFGLWQRRFASDTGVIGKSIALNSIPYTVVGVLPSSFEHPEPDRKRSAELYSPLGLDANQAQRRQDFLNVIARLKPSVSIEAARADLATIAARLAEEYQQTNDGWGVTIIPLHERFVGNVRNGMLVLTAAVGFLLLIACANVANLLLVRSTTRQKEVAIRSALGASRGRLIQQFLTESILLALLGGCVGTMIALLGIKVLAAFSPASIVRLDKADFDMRVFGFGLLVSLLTGIIFGVVPARRASKTDLAESLKESGRSSSEGAAGRRIRNLLAVVEIALALLLLVASGLMIRSFVRLQQVNPGFQPERMLTMELFLPRSRYSQKQQVISFLNGVIDNLGSIPGVQRVAAASTVPLSGRAPVYNFNIEGRPSLASGQITDAEVQIISPSYFKAMSIPLLQGRLPTEQDTDDAMAVTVISDAMAKRYWPSENPIGKHISIEEIRNGAWLTIVGIVADVRHVALDLQPYPQMYVSYLQSPRGATSLIVRTDVEPARLLVAIRERVKEVDPQQPLYNVRTMNDVLSDSISRPRFNTQLINILTAVALVLTAVGIYGVVSYSVSQRTHEIGIRMALGAQPGDILRMIVAQGFKLALAGIVIGLAGAFALTRLMESLLYDVSTADPLTLIGGPIIIAAVIMAACYIPARRAMRIDPMLALRYE